MPFSNIDRAFISYRDSETGSLCRAALLHGIAKVTLFDRNRGRQYIADVREGRQTLFPGKERSLAFYICRQALAGYPIFVPVLKRMANIIIERHPDIFHSDVPELVGKNWQKSFYFRNPKVIVERMHVLEQLRVNGACKDISRRYPRGNSVGSMTVSRTSKNPTMGG
jgi:hypothetical protein